MVITGRCQRSNQGSIPCIHTLGGGSYMAKGDIVAARALARKQMYGKVIEEGSTMSVYLTKDGRAQVMKLPSIFFLPSEFELLIEDGDYDRLLQQHGDVV